MSSSYNQDSPLSTTASIAGILTFVYAVGATILGYLFLLRSFPHADASIERFYDAFAACALESDLVRRDILSTHSSFAVDGSVPAPSGPGPHSQKQQYQLASRSNQPLTQDSPSLRTPPNSQNSVPAPFPRPLPSLQQQQQQQHYSLPPTVATGTQPPGTSAQESPYLLDPDSLGRLYSHVRTVEIELQHAAAKVVAARPTGDGDGNRSLLDKLLGRGLWISRARELEASLGKREALTARLLVVQLSLASGRMQEQKQAMEALERRVKAQEQDIAAMKEDLERKALDNSRPNGHPNGHTNLEGKWNI